MKINLNFYKKKQFINFIFIGVINTLIHGFVLMLAIEELGFSVVMSHLLAFFTANIFSYILNSRVTFKAHRSLIGYARFFVASIVSLCLTLFISFVGEVFNLHYLIGFLFVIMLVPVFNFLLMKYWTFKNLDQKNFRL